MTRCVACNHRLNSIISSGVRPPKPRQIAICFECGWVQAFDKNLELIDLDDEQIALVIDNPMVIEIQEARRVAKEKLKKYR